MMKIKILTLTMLIAVTSCLTVYSGEQTPDSKATSPEPKGSIVLWRVGSPHRGDTPPELVPEYLEDLANKQGYAVTVRSFEAKRLSQSLLGCVGKERRTRPFG